VKVGDWEGPHKWISLALSKSGTAHGLVDYPRKKKMEVWLINFNKAKAKDDK
jgi:hypothetical protein